MACMEEVDERLFVLGVDIGTSRVRCVAINKEGKTLAHQELPIEVQHPTPDASELDPEELWNSFQRVVKNALVSLSPSNVKCIGITTLRGTFMLWERESGKPLCNLITWQDRRAAESVIDWNESLQLKLIQTGGSFAHFFTRSKKFKAASVIKFITAHVAPRLWWLLNENPTWRSRAKKGELCFGTVDTWLIWKLTDGKVHATDYSNVSGTVLYDTYQLDWSGLLLNMFDIPKEILPEIKDSGTLYGHCADHVFGCSIPITGNISDQTSSTFAHMCWKPGETKCTMGTGMFVCINTGNRPHASVTGFYPVIGWKIGSDLTFLAEGMFSSIGSVVEWGKKAGFYSEPSKTEQLATSVDSSGGLCFVPCFDGIQAPYNDPRSTASIIGLTHDTRQAHIVRAMLESFAFTCKQLFDVAIDEVEYPITKVRVDGGVFGNDFVAQSTADLLQLPIERPSELDRTVYGATFVAGLASGFWQSREEIEDLWKLDKKFMPESDSNRLKDLQKTYNTWQKALERSLDWYT